MISPLFARILAAGRSQFNQRMAEARRRHPSLDAQGFADFLRCGVDPVLESVAAIDPARTVAVALTAYDLALELTGLSIVGPAARSGHVEAVWRRLAPALGRLVAERPAEVLGALSNAVIYLETVPRSRPDQWLAEMIAIAPQLDTVADMQAVGQIAAWRAGVAHFRVGAIEAANRLSGALALAAFAVGGNERWESVRASMLADPWWVAGGSLYARNEVGDFTGFGGEFAEPPVVRPHPDGFVVKCGERYHLLIADACGAVLHGASADEFAHAMDDCAAGSWTLRGSNLQIGKRVIELDLPASGLAACSNAHTVALTSPFTHAIRLFPAR